MMVVVLGELETRPVAEVETAHDTQVPQEIQRAVHRHQTNFGTSGTNLLETLVLLLHERPQHRLPLRRRLVPPTPHLPYSRPQPQPEPPLN